MKTLLLAPILALTLIPLALLALTRHLLKHALRTPTPIRETTR